MSGSETTGEPAATVPVIVPLLLVVTLPVTAMVGAVMLAALLALIAPALFESTWIVPVALILELPAAEKAPAPEGARRIIESLGLAYSRATDRAETGSVPEPQMALNILGWLNWTITSA